MEIGPAGGGGRRTIFPAACGCDGADDMQLPMNKLLRLLQADHPVEIRRAAALVLGELGVRDAEAADALCEGLEDPEPAVRLEVIRSVGKLRVEQALPRLLERIRTGGEEADAAAHAAAHLGVKGTRALQELMPKVAPGLRRYIAAALAGGGTASATAATAAVLLDRDPGVVEAAVRSLAEQIPTLAAPQRQAWTDQLLELAGDHKSPPPPATQTAVVRLLAALDDPRAGAALWQKAAPPHRPEVRAAALQALGKWAESPTKDQLKRLFSCAAEPDFRIAAPSLVLLQRLPVADRALSDWLTLLRAPDTAVRRLALDKVGDRDDADTAAALVEQLRHRDAGLRDAALSRLTRSGNGRKALVAALLEAETPDQAWPLARRRRRSPGNTRKVGARRCSARRASTWRPATVGPTRCCFCCGRPMRPTCATAWNSRRCSAARRKRMKPPCYISGCSGATRLAASRSAWSWRLAV